MTPVEASPAPKKKGVLEPLEHTAFGGRPFYDAELDVPQSKAHGIMVMNTATILSGIADDVGLTFLADHPIWYLHPETDEQRAYYGDCVLGEATDHLRITAEAVRLVVEVVSTTDRRKELKDTRFQPLLNEYNNVPEMLLLFPELDDARIMTWLRLVDGKYEAQTIGPGGKVASASVPGLEFRARPRDAWRLGDKFEIRFQGELRRRLVEERHFSAQEKQRAEQEKQRAEQEKQRAEQEKQRADAFAAKLRAMGVDPDAL